MECGSFCLGFTFGSYCDRVSLVLEIISTDFLLVWNLMAIYVSLMRY